MSVLKYFNGTEWKDVNGNIVGDTLPIGSIIPFGGTDAPTGWLLCRGQELSRSSYPELYSVIGDSFGGDDERETFYLPNLKGRVVVGKDRNDNDFDNIGETGGEKTHTLTIQEMPAHNHGINWPHESGSGTVQFSATIKDVFNELRTKDTGGGQAHNNLQPYIVTEYIIKVKQKAGVVGKVENTWQGSTTDTYSCDYINKKLSAITVFTGSTAPGSSSEIDDTWANIGKFSFMIVTIRTAGNNSDGSAIIPYNLMSTGNDLKTGARTVNVYGSFSNIGGFTNIHLVPSSDIGNNTIKFDSYGNDSTITSIQIVY